MANHSLGWIIFIIGYTEPLDQILLDSFFESKFTIKHLSPKDSYNHGTREIMTDRQ